MTPTQLFSCEIYEVFMNTLFTEHPQCLLLTVSGFQPVLLLKNRLRQRCFSINFAKFLRTSFDRNACGCLLFVFICEFWGVFQSTSFIGDLWETSYFMYKLQNWDGGYQSRNIVGHHGWPMKKIFHFKSSKIAKTN